MRGHRDYLLKKFSKQPKLSILYLQKVTRKPHENTVQMSEGGEAANCVVSVALPGREILQLKCN